MENDILLYGRSGLKRIVGLEVNEDIVEIFQKDKDGNVSSIKLPHKYWILSNERINPKTFARLKGDLHYKWGYTTTSRKTFEDIRNRAKHSYDLYSVYNAEEACMMKDGYTYYRDMQPKDLSVLSFDIETTGIDTEASDAKVLLISTTQRKKSLSGIGLYDYTNKLFKFTGGNENTMLRDFCEYVKYCNPDLLIGHNILSFDFPYLQSRCNKYNISFSLGRDGSDVRFNSFNSNFRIDGTRTQEYKQVKIYGREIVDTYFLASSFDVSKSIESYALKPMIKQLGLEKEGRQYYDASLIRQNYNNPVEWEKICQYAIEDAEDPIKLWDMMGPLYFNLAPFTPKPFTEILLSASGSKINAIMCRAYLQNGHSLPKADEVQKFEGALSWANPGIYSNCFKIDLEALYPNIMLQYEVYDKDKDPNKYLLQLVQTFREKRLEYKKLATETGDKYWQEMDTTAKSVLNSFYGFLGAPGLLFNSFECAQFITEKAREIIKYVVKWASGEELLVSEEESEIEVDEM